MHTDDEVGHTIDGLEALIWKDEHVLALQHLDQFLVSLLVGHLFVHVLADLVLLAYHPIELLVDSLRMPGLLLRRFKALSGVMSQLCLSKLLSSNKTRFYELSLVLVV